MNRSVYRPNSERERPITSFTIHRDVLDALRVECERTNETGSAVVERVLRDYLRDLLRRT